MQLKNQKSGSETARGFLWLFIYCKTKLEKKRIFYEKICFLQNIHYLQKKCVYMVKKLLYRKFFLQKKTFFTGKNINENVKIRISHLRNIFLCRKRWKNELLEKNLWGYLLLVTLRAEDIIKLTPPQVFFKCFVQVFR